MIVNNQYLSLAALQRVRRYPIVFHERKQLFSRDSSESASGDAKSLELARVETANDGLLTDLTNLGRFPRGEDRFHGI